MLAAATMLLASWLLLTARDPARSLTGGKNVGPGDVGAKASVALYLRRKPFCGGVVYSERYILTAAHCFTDGRGNIAKPARRIEVRYWSSEHPRREARKVDKLAVHENLLRQERLSYRSARPGDFVNFPVNHEDIAVLKTPGGCARLSGLVSQFPVTKLSSRSAPCGRDIGRNAYEATRVDYYHDWIIAKIKEMQE